MNVGNLLKHFPDAIEIRRSDDGDIVYGDRELSPGCGFLSLRESEIMFAEAGRVGGTWVEIGSHVGWSAAVIASAGCEIMTVDPEHVSGSPIFNRLTGNLNRAHVNFRCGFIGTSAEFFAYPNTKCGEYAGFLIDGCHDAPVPLEDAQGAAKFLAPHGSIVLHDYRGQPVKDAVEWLRGNGFSVETHDTINGLAVCWR